jgi:hypothetical protein
MAREKPNAWGCGHPLPIEVVPLGDGRRARCLSCGEYGPVRPDSGGGDAGTEGRGGASVEGGGLRSPAQRTSR